MGDEERTPIRVRQAENDGPPPTPLQIETIAEAAEEPSHDPRVVIGVLAVLGAVVLGTLVALAAVLGWADDLDLRKVALTALVHAQDVALGAVIGFLIRAATKPS